MKTVYLIRHGESEMNRQKRFAGWTDCNLTDLGINQATEAALRMAEVGHVDAIFSSDLVRAKKTAQIIADKLERPLTISQALRETNLGAWEALTIEEIEDRDPQLLKQWFIDLDNFAYPGGEAIADVIKRSDAFIRSMIRDHDSILIVAHAGVISLLLSHWLVGDCNHSNSFLVKNAKIQRLIFNGSQCSLDLFNG